MWPYILRFIPFNTRNKAFFNCQGQTTKPVMKTLKKGYQVLITKYIPGQNRIQCYLLSHLCNDLWEVLEAETMDLRALVSGAGWCTRETLTHRNHCKQSLGRCHIPELWSALTLPSGCWTDWRNWGWTIMWFTCSMKLELELCRILTWETRKIRDQILRSVLYSKPAGSIYYIGLWSSSADRNTIHRS